MADLIVELYGHHIGNLVGTNPRTFDFATNPAAFEFFPLGSRELSNSVPLELVAARGGHAASRRRNYFAELLPEGDLYTYLRGQAGIENGDTIAMLAQYGRDVSGAIQIYDPDRPGEPRTPFATDVDDARIGDLLRDARRYPLGNAKRTGKSLINGVQPKIVLARSGGGWQQPNDGYASTHILKPQLDTDDTTIFDEEYGSRIARSLGLLNYDTAIEVFDGIRTLVIERYDRSPDAPDGRIHQEDMNQALGASGNEKYQQLGGKTTLRRIADVFMKRGDIESGERLTRLNTLAVAVGNLDMHGKNISILHPRQARDGLAPAYDVVPTAHRDNDRRMALAINETYLHAELTLADIVAEAESWGVRSADPLVRDTLISILEFVDDNAPLKGAYPSLRRDIRGFTTNLLAGRPAGDE
ncbi:type II toxin-antitoxin system HipA family toxin [Leifsonia sp. L25]|uniref:type II toxin-antitoxin system HipA family toxin n=1 Tax=Actinomycetes TaxID=1760 RepID=UPI003D680755